MKSQHASYDAEPQPQSTALPTERAVGLREHLEDPSQFLLGNADSVVADAQHGFVSLLFERERDLPGRFGVLGGILQQVADHLVQPARITVDEYWPAGKRERERMPMVLDERPDRFDGLLHDVDEIEWLACDLQETSTDAGDVHQLVHETHEPVCLRIDRLVQRGGRGVDVGKAQQVNCVNDRRERVP